MNRHLTMAQTTDHHTIIENDRNDLIIMKVHRSVHFQAKVCE